MQDRAYAFIAGTEGPWRIVDMHPVVGPGLLRAPRLEIVAGRAAALVDAAWVLRGVTGHERYTTRAEGDTLRARQPSLGRPEATWAALIPIRKSPAWWALAQDERRAIFEERSRHIATGLGALPAIARRLYHGRDLDEPFDFLTWFEYAPADAEVFETLVATLRKTEEWRYVEREIDVRLVRE